MNEHFINRLYLGLKDRLGEQIDHDKAEWWINEYLDQHDIKGYTLLKGIGYWQGMKEHCFIVEVIADSPSKTLDMECVANMLAQHFNQDSVLVTAEKLAFCRFVER
jgi:hypothetical protein